jgi:hypothetical protein
MSEQRLIDANALDSALLTEGLASALIGYPRRRTLTVGEIRGILQKAPTVPSEVVVHCENCQHIHVLNTSEIYAICDKTNFVFQPFGVDAREFGCPYGKRMESEVGK